MAASQPSRLTRRTVLTGAAVLLAAGAVAPRPAGAAPAAQQIRAAADRRGDLLALCADTQTGRYTIRPFTVDADRAVAVGDRLDVELPAGFHPHSMAASGDTLWVTGAVDDLVATVSADNRPDAIPERYRHLTDPDDADPDLPHDVVELDVYRSAPALVRIDGGRAERTELAVPAPIVWGIATGIAVADGTIAVAIDGSPAADVALTTRSHLAVSADQGRTWTDHRIADGLGEGHGTVLAAVGDRVYAVATDGGGNQYLHATGADGALEPVDTRPGAGRPMAAIATADGGVRLFSDRDGAYSEARYGTGAPEAGGTAAECGCTGEVIAVAGLPGAWLESNDGAVRAEGTR